MTEDELRELLVQLLGEHSRKGAGLVEYTVHRVQDGEEDWISLEFGNGSRLAVTVEEL